MAIFRCYSTCSLLVFLLVLSHPLSTAVENSTAITTRYPAPPLDINRPPSVDYDYNGGEICVVLATSSTVAVIEAPDPGNGQNFSINLPLDVPLDVRQGQRPCILSNYAGGNCLTLVLFSTSMLPLGKFQAFLGPNTTTINYGPLGFVTPDGTNTVTFSETRRSFRLIYRTIMKNKESFTVCRNGTSVADFSFALGSFENCTAGNIGGFSVPFVLNVVYMGLLSEVVGYQLIVTTATCSAPESDLFVVLDVRSPTDTTSTTIPPVTPVDTPPPPTPSHPSTSLPTANIATSTSTTPTTSIMTTPTAQPPTPSRPGNLVALIGGIVSVAVVLLILGGICIAIGVKAFQSRKMNNCHQVLLRNLSQTKGGNDVYALVESGGSNSPAQQGTPEPDRICMQDVIQGTEGKEETVNGTHVGEALVADTRMNHAHINLPSSEDENISSVTQSPSETLTTTTATTSGQSEPAPTEQSKITPTTATEESEANPNKSGLSPNAAASPAGGEIVVDGDSGDGVDPDCVNAASDSDSIQKLDLSTTADTAGSSGGVTQSLSGEEGQVLENIHTESPDLTTYDVKASRMSPSDLKRRYSSAFHKNTKPKERLNSVAQSSKEKQLQDGYSQGGKSQYIDEKDTSEDVDKATSKINQQPDQVSDRTPALREELKEYLRQEFQEIKEDVVKAVKQQGAALSSGQNKQTEMLGTIINITAATREEVTDMRDHHFASKLEDDQGEVDEEYGDDQGEVDEDYREQNEDCSYKNLHTDD